MSAREKLDVTPTWRAAMSIYLAVLQDGTKKGKDNARDGLLDMANKMDWANDRLQELAGALVVVLDRLDSYARREVSDSGEDQENAAAIRQAKTALAKVERRERS